MKVPSISAEHLFACSLLSSSLVLSFSRENDQKEFRVACAHQNRRICRTLFARPLQNAEGRTYILYAVHVLQTHAANYSQRTKSIASGISRDWSDGGRLDKGRPPQPRRVDVSPAKTSSVVKRASSWDWNHSFFLCYGCLVGGSCENTQFERILQCKSFKLHKDLLASA